MVAILLNIRLISRYLNCKEAARLTDSWLFCPILLLLDTYNVYMRQILLVVFWLLPSLMDSGPFDPQRTWHRFNAGCTFWPFYPGLRPALHPVSGVGVLGGINLNPGLLHGKRETFHWASNAYIYIGYIKSSLEFLVVVFTRINISWINHHTTFIFAGVN